MSPFSRHTFLYFVARFAQTPSLFFVNIMKEENLKTQKRSAKWEHKHVLLRFTGLSVEITDKKMEKSKFSVVKWSSRNTKKGFEDKKRKEKTVSPE